MNERIKFDKLKGVDPLKQLVGLPSLAAGPDPQLSAFMIHWQR